MHLTALPNELLHHISGYLDPNEYLRLHSTNKLFYSLKEPYNFRMDKRPCPIKKTPVTVLNHWYPTKGYQECLPIVCSKGACHLLRRWVTLEDINRTDWMVSLHEIPHTIKGWLNYGFFELNQTRVQRMSLLQLAALCGHLEMCELLLDLGADINQTPVGFKGLTPLYFAIYSKNCHLCRYLLEKGAVLQQTRMQPSCVAIALAHGSVETVQMFMEHGMMLKEDEIQNELKSVMKYGTLASVQWMLEHPVAMQCYQECPDYCIQVVRDENTIDVVVYLINKAVFQSYRQAWLTSCMMKATFLDLVQDMKLLLDNGVFLNGYPNAPHSPLCRASFYNAIGVVKLLLDSGASMHIGNPRKICPLIHAVAMNHPGVCKILIERDPKVVQWACRDGFYGALHIATHAVDEDLSLMRLLLESGANVDARDTIGVTPLMIAAIFKNITKCQFLLEHGADIHRTDDYKRSVYSWALESKDQSTIAFVSDKLRLKA